MAADDAVVVENVETPMRDGVLLRATLHRPDDGRPHPVLLTRTPYGRDQGILLDWLDPDALARAGFCVMLQDVRGRFDSQGSFDPSVDEADDGADTVDWLTAQPWCDGRVGMWGRSYFSETQWRAAMRHPEGLKAMALGVAAVGNADNAAIFRGGAIELGSRVGWGHGSAAMAALERRTAGDPEARAEALERYQQASQGLLDGTLLRTLPLRRLAEHLDPFITEYVTTSFAGTPGSERSRLWDEPLQACPVPLPTMHIGGWYDIFLLNTLQQYRAQLAAHHQGRCPRPRLVLGPWSHTNFTGTYYPDTPEEYAFGTGSGIDDVGGHGSLSSIHTRWFSDVLEGRDADEGALAGVPPVLVFLAGSDTWYGLDELPVAAGRTVPLQVPGSSADVTLHSDPEDPVPTLGGNTMMFGGSAPGPADQRPIESRDDVLVLDLPPLQADTTLLGQVSAHVALSTPLPDVDVVVRLCRVLSDGRSVVLADGITRASWRKAYQGDGCFTHAVEQELLEPDVPAEVDVQLFATGCHLRAGERLRVHLATSSFPHWDRNLQTGLSGNDSDVTRAGEVTFHLDRSHLVLPVVDQDALAGR